MGGDPADVPGSGKIENFRLEVTVRMAMIRSLQYRYTLAPMNIGIKNTVLLEPVQKVVLGRGERYDTEIKAVYPFKGKIPLQMTRTMPAANGRVTMGEQGVQFGYLNGGVKQKNAVLEDGELAVCIRSNPKNAPPNGKYENGAVELLPGAFQLQLRDAAGSGEASNFTLPFAADVKPIGVTPAQPRELEWGPGRTADQTPVKFGIVLRQAR